MPRRFVMQIMNTEKDWMGSTSAGPHSGGLHTALLAIVILIACAVGGQPAFGADDHDQLYVTGVIKSVNAVTGIILVDVTSSSCEGMRTFKAGKPEILEDYIDQRISFFINSNRCEVREVYTILVERGIRK
jgi:hypothetical protein